MRDGVLFSDGRLSDYLQNIAAAADSKVAAAPPDEVRFAPDSVTERIFEEHRVAPVVFDFDGISRTEPREEAETIEQWGEQHSIPIHVLSIVSR